MSERRYKLSSEKKTLILWSHDAEIEGRNSQSWKNSVGKYKTYHESDSAYMKQVFVWSVEYRDDETYAITYSDIILDQHNEVTDV